MQFKYETFADSVFRYANNLVGLAVQYSVYVFGPLMVWLSGIQRPQTEKMVHYQFLIHKVVGEVSYEYIVIGVAEPTKVFCTIVGRTCQYTQRL